MRASWRKSVSMSIRCVGEGVSGRVTGFLVLAVTASMLFECVERSREFFEIFHYIMCISSKDAMSRPAQKQVWTMKRF